jgi:serine-type D-Ala-D-Ala carboxypeptidase/endopeptidase (penicillin-binding protein 4)
VIRKRLLYGTRRSGWRTAGAVTLLVVLAGAAGVGAYAGVHRWRNPPIATPTAASPAGDEASAGVAPPNAAPSSGRQPSPAGVAAALRGPLADPRLGSQVLVEVRDVASGQVLASRGAATPAPPASTAKLTTALALLAVHATTDRITTRVVAGALPGAVVLVGGGDPTLTGAAPGKPGAYADAARISDLARQLHGTHVTRVEVDDSLFTGPAVSPYWAPEDVPSDYAAAIMSSTVDGGRDTPGAELRSSAPDLAAGQALAAELGVHEVARGTAPQDARTLASVESAPIGTLVEQMLQLSDNVLAETLARQVALAEHRPASFAGAAAAVRGVLARLGVPIGTGLVDGSGLAAQDRLSADTLDRLLLLATKRTAVLDMLPVAAWSGTLAGRFAHSAGAGVVRAKTGTLTSVSTLAGLVHDKDGRLLAFAFLADRVGPTAADTGGAEAALDRAVDALATCGC